MVIFIETNGIGVGLGSNRSSGLIFTMLSSVGLVGTALFAIMFYKIIKSFPGRSASNSLQMVFWALITLTISEVLSVPDVNRPVLWALVMLVLVHLNVHFEPEVTKSVLKKNRVPLHPSLQGAPTAVPAS
jgi:DNA integrity scanning protein DisA with diadenylate cyclase activity